MMHLIGGQLLVFANQTTANVNDTVSISVIVDNFGLLNWGNVSVYIPVPKGLQYLSYSVPSYKITDYDPTTGIWNLNCDMGDRTP